MAGTRKARVPTAEQIRLINECRQSGMTDADWCRENDIAVSTFYNCNPNGSVLAIEGITSPDGRVLGKMGHTERSGDELYKNVPGNKYQPLFEGGVDYFKL